LIAEHSREHHRSYVYEPGSFRPLAMLDGYGPKKACPFYYQLDHLGTPQELTDYSGEIVWSATYKAYGKLASLQQFGEEQLEQPLRFQGQYFDAESGLHYNRHRYYNPDIGRYLTPDPSKLAGGTNGYQYTPNPTGWVDPLGLNDCPGAGKCKKPGEAENPAGKAGVDEGEVVPPSVRVTDKWSREPKSIQDQMTLKAAQSGEGNVIIRNLSDPDFKGMEKMELKVKSVNGNDSVVHFVRDQKTGSLLDFKFKKHSVERMKPWGNDPVVPPGDYP
ncbi:RHS repeat domain-containing protein, partial [Pseudomonas sp. 6D_7.1_Bac1]|uniref:RHS repeat domain-containing protein n=1 Tax=Pseudomonas sp. 6D_7.1_Bac1 TaxID=2971615 RepID=UPI0021C5FB43